MTLKAIGVKIIYRHELDEIGVKISVCAVQPSWSSYDSYVYQRALHPTTERFMPWGAKLWLYREMRSKVLRELLSTGIIESPPTPRLTPYNTEPCPACQSRQCDGLCHIEPTHRPSGRMCAECVHAMRTCGHLPFHTMQPIGKPDADGTQRVRCADYTKAT